MADCCEHRWETTDPRELQKHDCMKDFGHLGPHVCTCGERDKTSPDVPR
jgi:hypothetical protein